MKIYLWVVFLVLIDVLIGMVFLPIAISSNKWELFGAGVFMIIALPPINYFLFKKIFTKHEVSK